MISGRETALWAERFGVAAEQIRRDHLISHVINSLGSVVPGVRFFGGTALCRTVLDGTRLSEDIDLLDDDPSATLESLSEHLGSELRKEFPDATWNVPFDDGDGRSALFAPRGVDPIKVYVGRLGSDTSAWAFEPTDVQLRYSDLPATAPMVCPTPSTFAAMKLAAWFDRHAPRDLFDLAGLAREGALVDPDVQARFRAKMGHAVMVGEFDRVPRSTLAAWHSELAGQVGQLPEPDECLVVVRAALVAAAAAG